MAERFVEEVLLEEKMFRISIRTQVVTMRAWRDPNVPRSETERMAREAARALAAAMGRRDVNGLVLDMRHAPPMFGPDSEAFFKSMLTAWAGAGRRISVLVGEDPIQAIVFRRLVPAHAGALGAVHLDAVDGYRWA